MLFFENFIDLKNTLQIKVFNIFLRDENGILPRCERINFFNFWTQKAVLVVPNPERPSLDFLANLAGKSGSEIAILANFSKTMKNMHKPFQIRKKYLKIYSHLIFYGQKVKIGSNTVYRHVCPDVEGFSFFGHISFLNRKKKKIFFTPSPQHVKNTVLSQNVLVISIRARIMQFLLVISYFMYLQEK